MKNRKKKLKQVKIISFATDSKGEPLKDLSVIKDALYDQVEGYDPDVWYLAKGDARAVYDFKYNNQSLLKKGEQYFGGEAYLELMLLLDKKNHLRMVNRGNQEGTVRRMYQHVALLQKQYDKEHKKALLKKQK